MELNVSRHAFQNGKHWKEIRREIPRRCLRERIKSTGYSSPLEHLNEAIY